MNKSDSISSLIVRCKKNDREAQKELYLRFADLLMTVAMRYAQDLSTAKDLVHDTFIKAFTKIESFKPKGVPFEAWLKRILINEALQKFRRSNRIAHIALETIEDTPSTTLTIIDHLQAEDLLKVLFALPQGCRMVFNLYVMEGFNHQEIGELLNITPSASRAQLARAKKTLRKLLLQQTSYNLDNLKDGRSI